MCVCADVCESECVCLPPRTPGCLGPIARALLCWPSCPVRRRRCRVRGARGRTAAQHGWPRLVRSVRGVGSPRNAVTGMRDEPYPLYLMAFESRVLCPILRATCPACRPCRPWLVVVCGRLPLCLASPGLPLSAGWDGRLAGCVVVVVRPVRWAVGCGSGRGSVRDFHFTSLHFTSLHVLLPCA